MVIYEETTGKQAIWQGKITKGFLRWKEGEKDYYADKKRISVYVSSETEKKWEEFMKTQNYSSFSGLIRESVNYFIDEKLKFGGRIFNSLDIEDTSDMVHLLKEKLTTIKGFSQLLLEKYINNFNEETKSILNNVLHEIKELENRFIPKSEDEIKLTQYDILLIEDSLSTVELLKNYFESKGYSFKGVLTGVKGIEELNMNTPKLILLDIILPDISGYNICKDIKSNENLKKIPVFYITAVPSFKVESKMKETMANGYILKPFDLPDLEFLFNYLNESN
ncbi:MAG: response regulator [Promethearchaeota archaeon]